MIINHGYREPDSIGEKQFWAKDTSGVFMARMRPFQRHLFPYFHRGFVVILSLSYRNSIGVQVFTSLKYSMSPMCFCKRSTHLPTLSVMIKSGICYGLSVCQRYSVTLRNFNDRITVELRLAKKVLRK